MKSQKVFDSFLVLQFQSGNKKALELLVNRYHKKLCRHAFWYVGDFDTSKDIAQDCWQIICKKLHGLKDPNSFGSWAMRIVTRKSLDHLKRVSRNRENLKKYSPAVANEDLTEDRNEAVKKLRRAMVNLPDDQQVVLRLFYTEDYSLKEIAIILELSIGTVKSRLFHAREKLKTILKH